MATYLAENSNVVEQDCGSAIVLAAHSQCKLITAQRQVENAWQSCDSDTWSWSILFLGSGQFMCRHCTKRCINTQKKIWQECQSTQTQQTKLRAMKMFQNQQAAPVNAKRLTSSSSCKCQSIFVWYCQQAHTAWAVWFDITKVTKSNIWQLPKPEILQQRTKKKETLSTCRPFLCSA